MDFKSESPQGCTEALLRFCKYLRTRLGSTYDPDKPDSHTEGAIVVRYCFSLLTEKGSVEIRLMRIRPEEWRGRTPPFGDGTVSAPGHTLELELRREPLQEELYKWYIKEQGTNDWSVLTTDFVEKLFRTHL